MQFLNLVLSICAIGVIGYFACVSYRKRQPSLVSPMTYVEVALLAIIAFGVMSIVAESRFIGLGFALAVVGGFAYVLLERSTAFFKVLSREDAPLNEDHLFFAEPRPARQWRRRHKSTKAYRQIGPSNAAIGMTPYDTRQNVDLTGQLLDYRA